MSGIAGIIHFDGAPVEPGLVEQMTSAMAYRGPDGINHRVKGSVALGQCMLRTTPESLEETQPLTNEDESLVLVMDGRVDNWEELRRELLGRGTVLRNRSDVELALRAYQTWGRDCLSHIEGDFALVIWDARRQIAFCARDRMGNKPFYYHWNGRTLVFASELHPILALPWIKQDLNEGILAEFLASEWYSRDETFWQGILRLVAAQCMEVDSHGPQPEQYWAPDLLATLPYTKDEEYVEHYRELFSDVVRRMTRSHLMVACEVSGGLDSSAIFAMAQHLRKQQILLAPAIEGFSLDFHDDLAANELEYAHAVGEYWGVEIREILPARMPISWYREWIRHYRDYPEYPNGAMGLSIRTEASSCGSRVLMIGIGGDEWLWGDRSYYAEMLAHSQWSMLYDTLKADCSDAGLRDSIRWLVRFGFAPLLPETAKKALRKVIEVGRLKSHDRQNWLAPHMLAILQKRRIQHRASLELKDVRVGVRGHLRMLASGFSSFSRESEERLAASVGIELRLPFWDAKMVQFAFLVSSQRRLRGNVDRVLHRKAMTGLMPEVVLQRRTKADFMITYQRNLSNLKEDLIGTISTRRANWVRSSQVKALSSRCGQDGNGGWPEWMLWTLFGCDCLADAQKTM